MNVLFRERKQLIIDTTKIPNETISWLESIKAYQHESPILYTVCFTKTDTGNSKVVHLTYDYLAKTPLEQLQQEIGFKRV